MHTPELHLSLQDNEWPLTYTDHTRQIVRAIVFDDEGWFHFSQITRNDEFGNATLIETAFAGYNSVSGLFDDAGVGETMSQLIQDEAALNGWTALRSLL